MKNVISQIRKIDGETGELLVDVYSVGSSNGSGFVLMYTDKVNDLILRCPSAATLKIFMLLSMGQKYEERGMVTTKKAVQEKLGITKPTCIAAFNWLKENFIINECKIDGCTEFMVNPAYVTIGKDKKKRQAEWIRRWSGKTVATLKSPQRSIT